MDLKFPVELRRVLPTYHPSVKHLQVVPTLLELQVEFHRVGGPTYHLPLKGQQVPTVLKLPVALRPVVVPPYHPPLKHPPVPTVLKLKLQVQLHRLRVPLDYQPPLKHQQELPILQDYQQAVQHLQ
jgi:hypothetical protein